MKPNAFGANANPSYRDGPPRQVPGFVDLHHMVSMLLAERVPADGRILVLGAGGGLEVRALADAHPGWSFDGVDPSAPMLALAAETAAAHVNRVTLHHGYVDVAPQGPFDGATSLLTFHFIPREERLATLRQLRRRLKPGAPLVLAHISFPQTEPERVQWIARHVAWSAPDGATDSQMEPSRQAIGSRLSILSPDDDEALMREAGFSGVSLFYAALSFRGWVAYAG